MFGKRDDIGAKQLVIGAHGTPYKKHKSALYSVEMAGVEPASLTQKIE